MQTTSSTNYTDIDVTVMTWLWHRKLGQMFGIRIGDSARYMTQQYRYRSVEETLLINLSCFLPSHFPSGGRYCARLLYDGVISAVHSTHTHRWCYFLHLFPRTRAVFLAKYHRCCCDHIKFPKRLARNPNPKSKFAQHYNL